MQIEMTPIEQLVPYVGNARTHSVSQVAQIVASISEFGFTNPILVGSDSVIIAGHGRRIVYGVESICRVLSIAPPPFIV